MGSVESLKGMLLFSTPALFDPNFRRTVVLVAEHGEDGAMGLVLNRPSETTVGEAVPDLADVAGADSLVFVGGPVQPRAVLVLAEFDESSQAAAVVVGDLGLRTGRRRPRRAGGDDPACSRLRRLLRLVAGAARVRAGGRVVARRARRRHRSARRPRGRSLRRGVAHKGRQLPDSRPHARRSP